MSEALHEVYLPFTEAQLKDHFAPVAADAASADKHLEYYRKSVQAAADWASAPPTGTPAERAQAKARGLQMQKDERFWVVTALMSIFHAPDRDAVLAALLKRCLGEVPPADGLATWEDALAETDEQRLGLFFEVSLPTPKDYRKELAQHLDERVLIPHVVESAKETVVAGHALEGATKVDAMLIAPATGFAVLFEAKVLADASTSIRFDALRNQIARNIDVLLEPNPDLQPPLSQRVPERSCFVLLTPEIFRKHPDSRLYGWLMNDYRSNPGALQRDLAHRTEPDLAAVRSRLGWLTWEDCNEVLPGACPWLPGGPDAS